ncbi:MAG: GNAT family N-acetyltransferase [Candidatus Ornithospirochaeta sp.]
MINITKEEASRYRGKRYKTYFLSEGSYVLQKKEDSVTLYFQTTKETTYPLEDEIASSWLSNSVFYGVYDENNDLIGFSEGSMEEWNNRFRIVNLVVFNSRDRGKGIGSSLIKLLEKEAKDKGADSIFLETENTNTSAISFYKAKGYSIIGFDQYAYSKEGERMPIYMGKRLL